MCEIACPYFSYSVYLSFLAKPADYCVPPLIGDGRCQRMCNVPQNFYDNGDCCLASIVEHYCHNEEVEDINGDCVCHEDNTIHPGLEGKGGFSKPFALQMFTGFLWDIR
jgi:hypothetical protein